MKKILVTGADGFIGSHLTEELVRRGYKTKAFEFISNEHTRKNVMLVGRKTKELRNELEINGEINHLKESFKINRQELEDLLDGRP